MVLKPGDLETNQHRIDITSEWFRFRMGDDIIHVFTSADRPIGDIFRDSQGQICFKNSETGQEMVIPPNQNTPVGRKSVPEGFFGSSESFVSGSHIELHPFFEGPDLKLCIRDVGSTNGTICIIDVSQNPEVQKLDPVILSRGAEGHEKTPDGKYQVLTYLAGGTLKGHSINEDSVYMNPDAKTIAVADGMGGHGHGHEASATVIESVAAGINNKFPSHTIIHNAIRRLTTQFSYNPDKDKTPPGATLALATQFQRGNQTFVECTTVGDASIYVIHPGQGLIYKSKEQTFLQKLFDADILKDPMERYNNPHNNIITNAVAPGMLKVPPEIHQIPAPAGTVVLALSDGITDFVSPEEIVEIVIKFGVGSPKALQDLALSRQGPKFSVKLNGEMREVTLTGGDNIGIAMMVVD